jgi:hypothetical protein
MINLPENASLSEYIKYGNLPEQLTSLLEKVDSRLIELEKEMTRITRHEEVRDEQLYYYKEFISSVLEATKTTSKHKDLTKFIQLEFENSFIEL